MDREISKEVQRKEQRKQFIRIGTAVGGFIRPDRSRDLHASDQP